MSLDISYKRIASITSPLIVTQVSFTLLGVVDTIMVGRLGVQPLAAVGLANVVFWTFVALLWGLLTGVNTRVAQAFGARRPAACGVALWHGLYIGLGVAACLVALRPAVEPMLAFAGALPQTQDLAARYLRIALLGGPGFALLLTAENFYRGIGRTVVPMCFAAFLCLLNGALNYGLVYGRLGLPALGTDGAALGTVIATTAVGFALCATLLLDPRLRRTFHVLGTWRPQATALSGMLRLSVPVAVQAFWEMGIFALFSAAVARLGDAELAATNAAMQLWSVGYLPAFVLGAGAASLVGQCVGAGQPETARRVLRKFRGIGHGLMLATAAGYLLFPRQLMGLFLEDASLADVASYATPLIVIVAVLLLFETACTVGAGVLQGAGDTAYPMFVNVGVSWVVLAPAVFLVTPLFGVVGGWLCLVVYAALTAAAISLRLHGRRWLPAVPTRRRTAAKPLRTSETPVRKLSSSSHPPLPGTPAAAHAT